MRPEREKFVHYLEEYRDMPTTTLAKLIYKNHPDEWKNLEAARSWIRILRGKQGNRHRERLRNTQFVDTERKSTNVWAHLPESFETIREPFIVHGEKKILVLSDIHIPYHNIKAVQAAILFGKQHGANCIIINGDMLDFYMHSRYEKDPRKRRFSDELKAGRQFFQFMRYTFPNAQIVYKLGNHEERYEKWMTVKAPELLGCRDFELDVLLRLGEVRVEYVRDKRIIKAGKLNILHGHETQSTSGGVNPARTMFLKNKENTLVGHFHRASEHVDSSLLDRITVCVSTGCLCELSPDYMPFNEWTHGFAMVDLESGGDFHIRNYRIINGKIY